MVRCGRFGERQAVTDGFVGTRARETVLWARESGPGRVRFRQPRSGSDGALRAVWAMTGNAGKAMSGPFA
jgi:hypothetical protein